MELLLYIVEQSPVARTPSVDTLLHVAHDQVRTAFMTHGLVQQYLEVLPLNGARILKLVYHHVFQLGAYLLEDKGRIALANQGVE